jgi:calcineurin-like phosphoesterase family protein
VKKPRPHDSPSQLWNVISSDDLKRSGVPLEPRGVSSFDYPLQADARFRGLLITDFHISRHCLESEIQKFSIYLHGLVQYEYPTVLFILGDLIHGGGKPSEYFQLFTAIETLGIDCHIIPGNHDLIRFRAVVGEWRGKHVHLHMNDLIVVLAGDGSRNAVLGHDLGQCKTVRGQEKTRRWFQLLRQTYEHAIPQGALLVLGHVHELHRSADRLSWSIPRFAVGANEFNYAILRRGHRGFLKLKVRSL